MNLEIFKTIASGWGNYLFPDKDHEELAKVRAEICASSGPNGGKCPHADPNHKFKKYIPKAVEQKETIEEIRGLGCSLCNCPLSAATRAVSKECPIGKW